MLGLTLILIEPAPERLRAALTITAAHAALGGSARLFLQGEAVALLRPPITAPGDPRHAAAGLPELAILMDEALALGVEIAACQSGLALCAIEADALDPRIGYAGPVAILQSLGEDRLVVL